jgi:hypothetical protein
VVDSRFDQPVVFFSASRCAAYLRMYDDAKKLRDYAQYLLDQVIGISLDEPDLVTELSAWDISSGMA